MIDCSLVDFAQRQQIELLTARAIDRGPQAFSQQLKAIYADHSARGLLRSGATIKAAIRQMEASTREVMTGLLGDVGAVSRSDQAFAAIVEAIQNMLSTLEQQLPEIIRLAGLEVGSSGTGAAIGLYRRMKSDIEADLLIARHGFMSGPSSQPKEATQPPANRGGKPLAEHWDVMWSEVAALCWNGEFDPKSQAEIKRTMFDLLIAKGIDAGDTAVTERARQLWRAIEAKR